MLKFKKNLKKFTSIALAISMLMCSMFIISVNAADSMETKNDSVFTIPVFPIISENDGLIDDGATAICLGIHISPYETSRNHRGTSWPNCVYVVYYKCRNCGSTWSDVIQCYDHMG